MRVAVDAMGGDHAPRELVAGAIEAVGREPSLEVILVGREDVVTAEIEAQGGPRERVSVVNASEVIGMDEMPVEAVKKHDDASILRALQLIRAGQADAVVAAGSTGATVAASMMTLHRLPGVRRPGIGVPMPARNRHGVCLLLDGGANPNCRPHHLYQYGVMGANYFRHVFGEENPRVGLISIGEEETKGISLTKEALRLLRDSPVNFVGYVEDIFGGGCEVGVTDGFVGNIILKSAEGFAEIMLGMLRKACEKEHTSVVRSISSQVDYAEFGGAPLLGVDGVVVIAHGRSESRAITNAILASARAVDHHVNESIVRGLTQERASARP